MGYLYLIKNSDLKYDSYKIGLSSFAKTDDRILTHLALGWDLVCLWETNSKALALSLEAIVIEHWRRNNLPQQMSHKNMHIQKGWTETVGYKALNSFISADSKGYPVYAQNSPEDMVVHSIELLFQNAYRSSPNIVNVLISLGSISKTMLPQRVAGKVKLQGGINFMKQLYTTPSLTLPFQNGSVITNAFSGTKISPPLTKLVSAPQVLFPIGSGARTILLLDVVRAITALNDKYPAAKPNGYTVSTIYKALLNGLPQGAKYTQIKHYMEKSIESVLYDAQIQAKLDIKLGKTINSGRTTANTYWVLISESPLNKPRLRGIPVTVTGIQKQSETDIKLTNLVPSNSHFAGELPFGDCSEHAPGHLPESIDYPTLVTVGPWTPVRVRQQNETAFEFTTSNVTEEGTEIVSQILYNHNPTLVKKLIGLNEGLGIYAIWEGPKHYVKVPLATGGHLVLNFSDKEIPVCGDGVNS